MFESGIFRFERIHDLALKRDPDRGRPYVHGVVNTVATLREDDAFMKQTCCPRNEVAGCRAST